MFIVVHEDNEYKETLINVENIHFIRKVSEIIDPKYPNIKTLIGIDNGLMAIGVTEDYESIKKYIMYIQSNEEPYIFEQKSNASYYEDIRLKLKQFLMENYNINPSLSEKTIDEMFKRGTEFISLEEQKESEDKE